MSEYMTPWKRAKSALSILEVSKATLYRWRIRGIIQSRKIGGARYYNVEDFLRKLGEGP